MIGRQDTGNAYPTLESGIKAAHTKPILFFLSELATQIADVCGCCLSTRYRNDMYIYVDIYMFASEVPLATSVLLHCGAFVTTSSWWIVLSTFWAMS